MYSSNVGKFRPDRTDILVYTEDKLDNPRLSSRLYKILSHSYDPVEWSVYVDADVFIPSPEKLIEEVKESRKDIGVFKHPWRTSILEEAEEVIRLKKADENEVRKQVARYQSLAYSDNGLYYCGIIVRHHTPRIIELNEKWWAEYCAGCSRDQISFPFVFKDVHILNGDGYKYKKWL